MSEEKNNVIDIEIEENKESQNRVDDGSEAAEQKGDEHVAEESSEEEKQESEEQELTSVYYADQLLRAQAELQNYKRRTEQRMEQWRENAARELVERLLPVVDDFDILFNHHPDENESISIKGVTMIYNKFMSTLKDLGLETINADGQAFDPNIHEAVMAEESDEVEEGHILKVWQRGFTFKNSLMRPAKVITAKAKQSDSENGK